MRPQAAYNKLFSDLGGENHLAPGVEAIELSKLGSADSLRRLYRRKLDGEADKPGLCSPPRLSILWGRRLLRLV